MMGASVVKKRVTTEDLVKYGSCPVREFNVYIVGLDLMLIDKFKIVVDITETNFREKAKLESEKRVNGLDDYVVKVQGEFTTILLYGDRLESNYARSLCKTMDYSSKDYMKELDNDIVKICLKSHTKNDNCTIGVQGSLCNDFDEYLLKTE